MLPGVLATVLPMSINEITKEKNTNINSEKGWYCVTVNIYLILGVMGHFKIHFFTFFFYIYLGYVRVLSTGIKI